MTCIVFDRLTNDPNIIVIGSQRPTKSKQNTSYIASLFTEYLSLYMYVCPVMGVVPSLTEPSTAVVEYDRRHAETTSFVWLERVTTPCAAVRPTILIALRR